MCHAALDEARSHFPDHAQVYHPNVTGLSDEHGLGRLVQKQRLVLVL